MFVIGREELRIYLSAGTPLRKRVPVSTRQVCQKGIVSQRPHKNTLPSRTLNTLSPSSQAESGIPRYRRYRRCGLSWRFFSWDGERRHPSITLLFSRTILAWKKKRTEGWLCWSISSQSYKNGRPVYTTEFHFGKELWLYH